MKTLLPISVAVLFLFGPAFPAIQALAPNQKNTPNVPFHTPAYTKGNALPVYIKNTTVIGPEDGVILINNVITVAKGTTLTFKPGTIVAVAEYGGIRVEGNFYAIGTEKDPVQFISNELSETNRNWSGVLYENTGSGTIEHAIFHHASPAISCSAPKKVDIRNNKYLFGNLEVYGPC